MTFNATGAPSAERRARIEAASADYPHPIRAIGFAAVIGASIALIVWRAP